MHRQLAIASCFVTLALLQPATLAAQQEPVPPQPSTTPVLPPTDVIGEQPSTAPQPSSFEPSDVPDGSILDGTIFTSPEVNGYRAESSTTGTMIDVPDIQLPATVNVIPRDVLRDQQVLRAPEAFRDAGAVIPVGDGLFGDRIFIRGQEVGSRDFRKNGFFDPSLLRRDLANVERIEILKGPASVLYGAGQPAGVVNFITKRPVDDHFSYGAIQFGSFDLQRYTIDNNGYVTGDGEVLYRINAAYEDANSFRDFGFNERTFVAPAVTWVIDPGVTTLSWSAEYLRERRRGDTGIPAIDGDVFALPDSRYMGEPGNDFMFGEEYRQQLVLNHKCNEDWTLSVGGSSLFFENPSSQTFAVGSLAPVLPSQFVRARQDYKAQEQAQSGMVNLTGDVCTGSINHQLLFGTEQVCYNAVSSIEGSLINSPLNPFDAENPVYTNPPPLAPLFTFDSPVFRQERHGYYLQDYITLNPYWQLLGGVRFDQTHFVFQRDLGGGPIRDDAHFDRTVPRGGIVFQPLPDILSVYYNYGQSFNAPTGSLGFTATALLPELGEQHELGVKTRLTEELSLNVAGFYINRENVPFADIDPLTFQPRFFQLGQQRSQGMELNLVGQLTDVWSVIGNYAYTDTELTDPANPILVGQPQRNVPLNSGSVWTRYNFIQNECRTFGAAIGVIAVGSRTADLEASLLLPSYNRWDMGVYYQQGRMNASVYIENLLDQEYALSSINTLQIMPGAPLNARAQIGFLF